MWTRLQPPTHAISMLPEHYPASHGGQRDSVQGSGQHPIIQNHKEFQEQIKVQLSGPDVAQGQRRCAMKVMGCQVLKSSCLESGLAQRPGRRPACGQRASGHSQGEACGGTLRLRAETKDQACSHPCVMVGN